MSQGTTTPLLFRLAELLRAVTHLADPQSEWRERALAALAEYDEKNYAPNEPVFVLRGKDPLAACTVRHWAAKGYMARLNPDKLIGALDIADAMDSVFKMTFPGALARDPEREAVRGLIRSIDAAWRDDMDTMPDFLRQDLEKVRQMVGPSRTRTEPLAHAAITGE